MTDAKKDTSEGAKEGEVDLIIEKTEPVPEEVSITPAEPEPAALEPKEDATEPIEKASTETKLVEERRIETAPVENEAVRIEEVKPAGNILVEPQQAESKPTEEVAEKALPAESTESTIDETKTIETAPAEPTPAEPSLVESKPVEEETPVSRPSNTEPTKVDPIETKAVDEVDDFSDPDEDDLDDLDDMLDDFSTVKLDSQKAPATSDAAKSDVPDKPSSSKEPELNEMFSEEEFAKQLQAGMADLLGELEKSPDMQAEFEDIFKQIAASEGTTDPAVPSSSAKPPPPQPSTEDASFQDTIRRTMERMQASGDQATAAAASGGGDDFMSEMLKQLSSGDLGALGGEENEEEFSKMLMGMMEQLTNREILYEPMKELDEKFPEWLAKNRSTTPKDDLKRYEEQQAVVREIVAKFEEKTYSDSNAADREFIVDKMQKMQAAGSPPSDLVGDMPSAQEALNPGDEACNPQ